jgi:hypothetical protein
LDVLNLAGVLPQGKFSRCFTALRAKGQGKFVFFHLSMQQNNLLHKQGLSISIFEF